MNSEMKDRLRKVRKALGLTQEATATRIGIKRNTWANYEIGRNEPIDAVIFSFCKEFNVNEMWLREGIGEMFKDADEEMAGYLADIISGEDEFIQNFVMKYMRLGEESKEIVRKLFEKEEQKK